MNRNKKNPKRSGLKGVSWDEPRGKWRSQVWKGNKSITLGRTKSESEAHKMYLKAKKRNNN